METETLKRPVVTKCVNETLEWQEAIALECPEEERAEIAAHMIDLWWLWYGEVAKK